MATIYYDDDADLGLVQSRKVAVLGYGSQGHAHALSLHDSGCEVRVGLAEGSSSRAKAEAAGLTVTSPAEASAWADLIMVLVPDTVQRHLYRSDIAPNLNPGDALFFAHGFNIHFGYIEVPDTVDVAMVAPKGPGHLVRRQFENGQGTPVLVAVAQDASGKAWDLAKSYARAIGGTRAGALVTTFQEETETDLFGEQAVLCGGATALVQAGFETLTKAGYQPEVAYFECLHELKLIVDLLYEGGLAGMRYSVSDTAEYGDYSRGPRIIDDRTKAEMGRILSEIQSGAFAREWVEEDDQGRPNFTRMREAGANHPIERTGKPLRRMMSWLQGPGVASSDMARVLIAEPLAEAGVELLRTAHEVDARTAMTREELLAAVAGVEALVVRSATRVDAEVLETGRDLKVVGRAGIGLDNVDVAAATRLGIMVVNAPQSNVISAAEHTVALILAQARNIPQADAALRDGRWERSRFQGAELYGKTLGIVGLGRVGALVAQRCNAFGMRLLAYDPFVSRERAAQMGVELASLAEVLGRADVITVHLPKTPETTGLIGEAELAAMKRGARLVNTARGGIVDEAALAKAVGDGLLAGAALDVFAEEPTTQSPLFELDEVVVTPHLGASTAEAQDKAGVTIAEQLLLALAGQFVPNAVNVDAGPVPDALRPFLGLVEKLGQLYVALAGGGPGGRTSAVGGGRLQIDYVGALVEQDIRVLTLAALKGMLGPVTHEPVTFVNAPLLAADRGIEVTESKTRHSRDWVNLITLSGEGSRGPVGVAGTTVGPRDNERLVAINGIAVDMAPARHMAFLFYEDRPGVIGRVGTLLGESGVNIAQMQVGRRKQGGEALMALTIDAGIPAGVLDRVEREIGAHEATFIQLTQTGAGA